MTENSENLNIFKGAPASFRDALRLFAGVTSATLPVRPETAGPALLYTLAAFSDGEQPALPAFTDENLLTPPLLVKSLADTAALFFHAPGQEIFIFNPRHPQSRFDTAPLKASRRDISLLAGFIRTAKQDQQEDPARLAAGEFALGNLHAAHYLYDLAAARNPASRDKYRLGAALLELGLLQEAYDSLKDDTDPEALLSVAIIHRKTGNAALARKTLAALGQGLQVEERRAIESAWLDLEEGKEEEAEKIFQRLSYSAFDKVEALSGLGAAMAKTAFKTKDRARLAAAAGALKSALTLPSPASGRIFFQLGNLYFRSGEAAQAEDCYRRSAALAPSIQALANLALTLIKTGKLAEAAAVTAQVALTDIASARRLAAGFPKDLPANLFQPQQQPQAVRPPPPPIAPQQAAPAEAQQQPSLPAPIPGNSQPEQQSLPDAKTAGDAFEFIKPAAAPPPADGASLLFPAQPQPPAISGRPSAAASPPPGANPLFTARPQSPAGSARQLPAAPAVQLETVMDTMSAAQAPTEEESRRDDFISRAFKLASELEDELGRKIYFNLDGLSEVEKKLRLKFMKAGANPQASLESVRDCAAFLCYFLQERHKGRLIKLEEFDPWGWPMVFGQPGHTLTTYPVQRAWRLLWEETLPEPGWLTKYSNWLADGIKAPAPPVCGAAAARAKTASHPERIIDAQTEHKRMLVLLSSLPETSHIELGRTGIAKLEAAVKNSFKPDIPPSSDGWKLLRCYGHLLAEILAKDFKASWYNVDGDDGGWSMRLPWKTFVFPLGKIYKTASLRDDLAAYYEILQGEKLRQQTGPK